MGMAVALNPRRDARELLRSEHRAIDSLLERYELLAPDDQERVTAAIDVAREFTYHAILESEVVFPAIEAAIESECDADDVRTALEIARLEIDMANALIERSEALHEDAVRLDAVLRLLIPLVRRHLSAEDANLLPVLCNSRVDSRQVATRISEHRFAVERAVFDVEESFCELDDD
jgi:hemerythrin-like domain-containing protein